MADGGRAVAAARRPAHRPRAGHLLERHGDEELDELGARITDWAEQGSFNFEHDPALRRWYVRLKGEDKDVITIWLTLRERTLHHEAYVLPAPEENAEDVYSYFLRANARLYGMAFAIGEEEAIFLRGQVPIDWLDGTSLGDELDRIVGSTYEYCERHFRTALRLAFASRFPDSAAGSPSNPRQPPER